MKEYIEREKLNSFFDRQIRLYEPCPDKYDAAVELKGASLAIHAADVREVVRGEWKFDGDDWFCSKCNHNALCDKYTGEQVLSAVCPNCGADMRSREKSLAFTNPEQSVMRANASIARNE